MRRVVCFKTYFIKIFVCLLFLSLFTMYFFSISLPEARSSGSIQEKSQTSAIVDGVETIGEQKTLVALFNYADDQREPISLNTVKNWIMYDTQSINNFVKENSYGKTWLNPTFIDWRTLPSTSSEYDRELMWSKVDVLRKTAIKVLDEEVYFPDYKRLIFIFLNTDDINICGWGEFATTHLSEDGEFDASVTSLGSLCSTPFMFTHELGHSIGAVHATSLESLEVEGDIKVPPPTMIDLSTAGNPGITFINREYGDSGDDMGGGILLAGQPILNIDGAGLSLPRLRLLPNQGNMYLTR